MRDDEPADAIQSRILEAENEIILYEEKISDIKNELSDLKIAQSVNKRFGIKANIQEKPDFSDDAEEVFIVENKNLTISEMVTEALIAIEDSGGRFVSPQVIFDRMTEKCPNLKSNHVKPIIWRMAKQGRLDRRENQYALPEGKLVFKN